MKMLVHSARLNFFITIILVPICFLSCKGQEKSISGVSEKSNLAVVKKLCVGVWRNIKDTNCFIRITSDSMYEKNFSEPDKRYVTSGYRYSIGYREKGKAVPAGGQYMKQWCGFYIQAWDDSTPMEVFRTIAICSISQSSLKLDPDGKYMFKREK